MKTEKFIVSVKKHNKWKFHSDHDNLDYAIINAEVQEVAGLEVRVTYKGEIVNWRNYHAN